MEPTSDQIALAAEEIIGEEATVVSRYESWLIDSEHAPAIAAAALEPVLTVIEKRIEERIESLQAHRRSTGRYDLHAGAIEGLQAALGILRGTSPAGGDQTLEVRG